MRTALVAAAGMLAAAIAPTQAYAQGLPETLEIETCWFGVCVGVYSRFHRVVPNPIIAPNQGQLWNSQGFAGEYSYDPFSQSLSMVIMNFPIGIYSGQFVNGCLSGTTVQYYYNGYGDFFWEGCP
jgi:hypothetical protein